MLTSSVGPSSGPPIWKIFGFRLQKTLLFAILDALRNQTCCQFILFLQLSKNTAFYAVLKEHTAHNTANSNRIGSLQLALKTTRNMQKPLYLQRFQGMVWRGTPHFFPKQVVFSCASVGSVVGGTDENPLCWSPFHWPQLQLATLQCPRALINKVHGFSELFLTKRCQFSQNQASNIRTLWVEKHFGEKAGLQRDSPFCDVLSLESNTQIPTSHASFLPWHPEVSNVTLGCPKQNTEPVEVPKLQTGLKMSGCRVLETWESKVPMWILKLGCRLWVGVAGSRWMSLVSSPTHILMVSFWQAFVCSILSTNDLGCDCSDDGMSKLFLQKLMWAIFDMSGTFWLFSSHLTRQE